MPLGSNSSLSVSQPSTATFQTLTLSTMPSDTHPTVPTLVYINSTSMLQPSTLVSTFVNSSFVASTPPVTAMAVSSTSSYLITRAEPSNTVADLDKDKKKKGAIAGGTSGGVLAAVVAAWWIRGTTGTFDEDIAWANQVRTNEQVQAAKEVKALLNEHKALCDELDEEFGINKGSVEGSEPSFLKDIREWEARKAPPEQQLELHPDPNEPSYLKEIADWEAKKLPKAEQAKFQTEMTEQIKVVDAFTKGTPEGGSPDSFPSSEAPSSGAPPSEGVPWKVPTLDLPPPVLPVPPTLGYGIPQIPKGTPMGTPEGGFPDAPKPPSRAPPSEAPPSEAPSSNAPSAEAPPAVAPPAVPLPVAPHTGDHIGGHDGASGPAPHHDHPGDHMGNPHTDKPEKHKGHTKTHETHKSASTKGDHKSGKQTSHTQKTTSSKGNHVSRPTSASKSSTSAHPTTTHRSTSARPSSTPPKTMTARPSTMAGSIHGTPPQKMDEKSYQKGWSTLPRCVIRTSDHHVLLNHIPTLNARDLARTSGWRGYQFNKRLPWRIGLRRPLNSW